MDAYINARAHGFCYHSVSDEYFDNPQISPSKYLMYVTACAVVRNHNSVGMKRPYLHKLSIDHLHYGVI
jgi:hypothetical protein